MYVLDKSVRTRWRWLPSLVTGQFDSGFRRTQSFHHCSVTHRVIPLKNARPPRGGLDLCNEIKETKFCTGEVTRTTRGSSAIIFYVMYVTFTIGECQSKDETASPNLPLAVQEEVGEQRPSMKRHYIYQS